MSLAMESSPVVESKNGIRQAVPEDVPRLVEMGRRFVRETEYADKVGVSPEHMQKFGTDLLANPAAAILVCDADGELRGMLALLIYPHPFSGESTAVELFWWVEPEHRGTGRELLQAGEQWARERGAKRMQVIAPNERVAKLYRRKGYGHVEDTYQRELN